MAEPTTAASKSQTNDQTQTDSGARPGSINLLSCSLTNFDQSETQDLTPKLLEFNVYRSIFSPYLRGNVVITDSLALPTRMPIVGEENIQISYQTPSLNPQSKSNPQINIRGRVTSMTRVSYENVRSAIYRLDFVSQYRLVDLMKVVRDSFGPGTISDMVKKVAKDHLNIANIDVDETSGQHKFVIPTWSPFQTMIFFCREAESSTYKPSNFVFFEDHDKHCFKTIDGMIDTFLTEEGAKENTYYFRPKNLSAKTLASQAGADDQIDEFKFVDHVDIRQNFDVEIAIKNGMYDNKVYWIDLLLQQYEATEIEKDRRYLQYTKDFSKFEHTAKKPNQVISKYAMQGKGQGESHIRMIHATPNQTWEKHQVTPRARQKKLPYLVSSLQQLDHLKLDLTVPGDTSRKLGDIILLDLHELGATDDVIGELHAHLKGKWLVTSIRDKYTNNQSFQTIMEVVKNAYEEPIKNQKAERSDGTSLTPQQPVVMPPLPPSLDPQNDPDPAST